MTRNSTRDQVRDLGRNIPAGVSAITGWSSLGEPLGTLVSTFVPLSHDEPKLFCFSIAKGSRTFSQLRTCSQLGVSILASDQAETSQEFSTAGPEKFNAVAWHEGAGGLPCLDGSVASLAVHIVSVHDAGDKELVVVEVDDYTLLRDNVDHLALVDGMYGRVMLNS